MRIGNWDIRPLGGGVGCLTMVLLSIVASIVLTVLVNVLLHGWAGVSSCDKVD